MADDENGQLFVGEEARGIWKFGAEPGDSTDGELIARQIPRFEVRSVVCAGRELQV